MSKENCSLGSNPIDPVLAYRAAIESSLNVESSLNECCENARDWGKEILVTLHGDPIPEKPDYIKLTSATIEDDGAGMDLATLIERFRGAYYDSASHGETDKSGRNGVGVKTNLQHWKEIYVETTTSDLIPKGWGCTPANEDKINEAHKEMSSLRKGSADKEIRKMVMRVEGSELLPFEECSAEDHWTIVTLRAPRGPIEFNVKAFLKRQSHCIEWLDKINNKLTLKFKNSAGSWDKKEVQSFYKIDNKDKWICHLKGNSGSTMYLLSQLPDGTQKPIEIPAVKDVKPMDIDIKVMEKDMDPQNPNDFVISICGANIYDQSKGKTPIPEAVDYLLRQYSFKSGGGFGYRLHGYIKTNDDRLKRALRHNKSVLDEEDRHAKTFVNYIIKTLLDPMNKVYTESFDVSSEKDLVDIFVEIKKTVNNIRVKVREKTKQERGDGGETPEAGTVKHKEYKCNSCGLIWKVPLSKNPSYCAEFNVKKGEGCDSRDIDRNVHAKNEEGPADVDIKPVDKIGGFLPARYEPTENTVYIATMHPSFITTATGMREKLFKATVGIEKAFFAIAMHESTVKGRPITEVYGELLKEWFMEKSKKDSQKSKCLWLWKEKGIVIEDI